MIRKIFFKCVFFTIIICFFANHLGPIFSETRRGVGVWNDFYKEPKNTLDLVFMGSSLSYSSFNPLVINGSLKIKSYNLATALQNIKQSYYNLLEILKYQSPKTIVLEAYTLDIPDLSEENRLGFKFENLDGQKLSLGKLKATNQQFKSFKNKINALLPFVRNHNNWGNIELIEKNLEYTHIKNRFLGYKLVKTKVTSEEVKEGIKRLPLTHSFDDENLKYFKKFVELCKLNKIRIIVTRAPTLFYKYNKDYYLQAYKNTNEVCKANDLIYIDYNQKFDDLGLDMTCFWDPKHLNYKGATKVSESLVKDLKNKGITGEKTITKYNEPEDYIYSNAIANQGQTIFKGNFLINDSLKIKEVKVFNIRKDEYSVVVKMNKGLNPDLISEFGIGYYFYPIDSHVQFLETKKDLKRKYTSIGDHSIPMSSGNNIYIALRSLKTKMNSFKTIKIEIHNQTTNDLKYLVIKDVNFNKTFD
ncbi:MULTISPECIES: hypothetical protein [Aquimarina]|uniref:SGNH/GDSL hydrolase family protein n=1 Tax=Aquimarina algiphila TaxID=2047982 RepID=A0A554VG19_9FLAO|nr:MULTISPECIES: hypothetical protein [Aquimarina]TSE06280.1 hypothetical protein FOF46_20045 [Aquimarina algiphila]